MKTVKDVFAMCGTKDGFDAVMKFLEDMKIPVLGAHDGDDLYIAFPLHVGGIHEVEEILHAHGGGYVTY